jgi:hypothetical protein
MRQRAHQVGNKTRGTARLVTYKPEDNRSAYLETNPEGITAQSASLRKRRRVSGSSCSSTRLASRSNEWRSRDRVMRCGGRTATTI